MIPLTRQEQLVILFLVLASTIGLGIYFYETSQTEEPVVLETPAETNSPKIICIDVGGAVWRPGVYKLKSGSRVGDVLEKALPRDDANLDLINSARPLMDGEKILVPSREEAGLQNDKGIYKTKTNINTASKEELMKLPNIGNIRADEIINYRKTHGYFKNIEKLKGITGIGEKNFERLKDLITVR